MKRLALYLLVAALGTLAVAASAQASFGLKSFDVTYENEDGSPATQAGSHPFAVTSTVEFSTKEDPKKPGNLLPDGSPKDLVVGLPAGLVGDREAMPRCSNADFVLVDADHEYSNCPDDTVVGVLADVRRPGETTGVATPAFNLAPPPGTAAKIGFVLLHVPVALLIRVSPIYPHNLVATLQNTSDVEPVGGASLTIWGNPASSAHDSERGSCLTPEVDLCHVEIPEKPFLTLPRSCEGPLFTTYAASSWEEPGNFATGTSAGALDLKGCDELGFEPEILAKPTSNRAESPSGLDFNLDLKDEELTNPTGKANSDLKKAVVALPRGVTLNPSAASGLVACSRVELARETPSSEPGEGCPEASKVGSVEAQTQLLRDEDSKEEEVLNGSVYVATPDDPATTQPGAENPFDSLIALYMVIKDPELGILVRLAGKVDANPVTGQLTTTFGEPGQEIPQFPVSHFRFHFRPGDRAPLVTPPNCGSYTTDVRFTTWAKPTEPIPAASSFPISTGIGGAPCPAGAQPFKPGFSAGSNSNTAGAYSPFYLRLTRNDGEQEITRLDTVLPPGVVGKIAGLGRCSDTAIAAAKTKTGRQELAAPSCPASSQVGRTLGGAGVGSSLIYVPGSVYLAGPFAGAQLSIVAITPAVAGPFDAGTVVVRQALTLDPITGEVLIDGSASDPIPHILKGIPLRLRDLRVYVDRPDFTINPTSCASEATRASLFGSGADVFSTADDTAAAATSPYQASNCAALKFKPKLALNLKGGTQRNDHPSLRSVLTYPKGPGYANIGKAVVTLPRSEFIDNAHIQNPCTRVQFAAQACPKASILGTAKATTPLLDEPLEGPVYFRSNGGERLLPDVVADLNGLFHIVLVGKVDSKRGRIRTTFDQVPDAPVSKFTLTLRGGKKGLLVNSRDLCANQLEANVTLDAKNGRTQETTPVVGTSCKQSAKHKKRKKH
jgi:hypothetical protein